MIKINFLRIDDPKEGKAIVVRVDKGDKFTLIPIICGDTINDEQLRFLIEQIEKGVNK